VVDLDIQALFDTVPWDRVLAAVAVHTDAACGRYSPRIEPIGEYL